MHFHFSQGWHEDTGCPCAPLCPSIPLLPQVQMSQDVLPVSVDSSTSVSQVTPSGLSLRSEDSQSPLECLLPLLSLTNTGLSIT